MISHVRYWKETPEGRDLEGRRSTFVVRMTDDEATYLLDAVEYLEENARTLVPEPLRWVADRVRKEREAMRAERRGEPITYISNSDSNSDDLDHQI